MKRKINIFIVLIVIFLFIILAGYDYYYSYSIKETKITKMDITIPETSKMIGVNPDGDALHFGLVPRSSTSQRNFTLYHNYSYALKVDIKSTGNITQFIVVSDNNFILKPNINKSIKVKAIPSLVENPIPGNYSGNLTVIFRKPLIYW